MPGYLSKALLRFKHQMPYAKQKSLHPHAKPQYGAKAQYATDEDTSTPLSGEEAKYVQEVAGTLLYNARSVKAKPTEKTKATIKQLLRLLLNSGGSSTCIQSKQNDSCSTQ
jgi:hypothetical protein